LSIDVTGYRCRNTSRATMCALTECWVRESYFCDGLADCEDESDEDATFCREFSAQLHHTAVILLLFIQSVPQK